jgi:hypothetical protein
MHGGIAVWGGAIHLDRTRPVSNEGGWGIVVCERERVMAVEPAVIGVTAFVVGTQRNHVSTVPVVRRLPIEQRVYPWLSQMG